MSNDDLYVYGVLRNHQTPSSQSVARGIITTLSPSVNGWAGVYLSAFHPSGSIAKGTAISGTTDVDLLISLHATTPFTLQYIYENLFSWLTDAGYQPRRQNVSLGLSVNGWKVDIVPAKRQNALSNDHSLWSHKKSTWRQTNVYRHVQLVSQSGRLNEIKLLKIWRKLHNLDFPSFLLEMAVINALRNRSTATPAANFVKTLEYVRDTLPTVRIIDPANTNNIISDELTVQEKRALASIAATALNSNWNKVIW